MMSINDFKTKALEQLDKKAEPDMRFPIVESDIIQRTERCIVCNSGDSVRLAEVLLLGMKNILSTDVCPNCFFVYRSVFPSFAWFQKCWRTISTENPQVFNPEVEEIRRKRYQRYYEILARYETVKYPRVLDIGAGYGAGINVFREKGWHTAVIEPEFDRADYIERHMKIPVGCFSAEEFVHTIRSQFNYIILSQSLEHMDGPEFVLSRLGDQLSSNGKLYLEVPILEGIVNWSDALYMAHKVNFTEENLRAFVKKCGFKIVETVVPDLELGEPRSIGLVLAVAKRPQLFATPDYANGRSLESVRRLYRHGLPLDSVPSLDSVLKYYVPYIEHFYYTMRLDKIRLDRLDSAGLIDVVPTGE